MSIRTTVTLDEDVVEGVKLASRSRGSSFRDTLNDLLRFALLSQKSQVKRRSFKVKPFDLGLREGLSYDDVQTLIEFSEGPSHR